MKKKVLVIDDSLFIRTQLREALENEYEIYEGDCGVNGLMEYSREMPDMVLLDLVMPEGVIEGLHVLRNIRQRDPNAKVMMISAVGQDSIIQKCKKAGALDFITKPFNYENVIDKVNFYLKNE